jgi:hypothetical protein
MWAVVCQTNCFYSIARNSSRACLLSCFVVCHDVVSTILSSLQQENPKTIAEKNQIQE